MSRRAPDPAAERAAKNTQILKSLVKLEQNKTCSDCKRNKHPRWASWNLGIFICIRCSGIHRGMGTHISRVKSVDLDSWTDEQLQSVLKWGNSRANKYWEAKLAPGHVPSEAKIENFIRTKYESKRWVMEGGIPDPSTLDVEGDDDVPLNLVKEKVNIGSTPRGNPPSSSNQASTGPSSVRRAPQPDLFGDDEMAPRSSSAAPTVSRPAPPSKAPAPPKQTKPADSLLGLDFFGSPNPPPNRPASTGPASSVGAQSRPDLKQSILSLYASAPRQNPAPAQPPHSGGSFGGMQSPSTTQNFSGMNDQFGGLSFGGGPSSPPQQAVAPKHSAFAGLDNLSSSKSTSQPTQQTSTYGGGNFFDTKPAAKAAAAPPQSSNNFGSSGFGDFGSATPAVPKASTGNGLDDLFDFGSTTSAPVAPKQTIASPPPQISAFNLSKPQQPVQVKSPPPSANAWNNSDAWASNDAWGQSDSRSNIASPATTAPPKQASANDFGWGSGGSFASQSIVPGGSGGFSAGGANPLSAPAKPAIAADDDFGGWSSAAPVTPAAGNVSTPGGKPASGFGGSDDLFSNAWA